MRIPSVEERVAGNQAKQAVTSLERILQHLILWRFPKANDDTVFRRLLAASQLRPADPPPFPVIGPATHHSRVNAVLGQHKGLLESLQLEELLNAIHLMWQAFGSLSATRTQMVFRDLNVAHPLLPKDTGLFSRLKLLCGPLKHGTQDPLTKSQFLELKADINLLCHISRFL